MGLGNVIGTGIFSGPSKSGRINGKADKASGRISGVDCIQGIENVTAPGPAWSCASYVLQVLIAQHDSYRARNGINRAGLALFSET